jgi:hypothetical protein
MVQEGKERLPGPFSLCLSGLNEPPPLFFPQERSDEEAHGSPAESEVLHGNQQRYFKMSLNQETDNTSSKIILLLLFYFFEKKS